MSGRRALVSLSMIVRDEEQNLAACLSPVTHLFDEIVIVDTGSRDRTKEVARRFTPHVYDFPWCDDFSAARNESLRHVTGDWVFWLDADDRMDGQNLAKLKRVFESELTEWPRVFFMDTLLPPTQRGEDLSVVTHARLFRRSATLRWRGRVHEQLLTDDDSAQEPIFSSVQIQHTGYLDAVLHESKTRRNLRLLRMDYTVDPNDPSTLFNLGMTLSGRNRVAAKRYLRQLIEMDLGQSSILRPAYGLLAELSLADGQIPQASTLVDRGLQLFAGDERLLFTRAALNFTVGNYAVAAVILQQIIQQKHLRRIHFGTPGNIREKLAPRMLGSALRLQKAYQPAEALLRSLVTSFPEDTITWYNLGLLYLDEMRLAEFSDIVRKLLSLPQGSVEAGLLTALWYLRHADPGPAGPIIDQLISEAPQKSQPRMLRAEWLSRVGAPAEAQIRALNDVLRVEPANVEASGWLQKIKQAGRSPAVIASPMAPFTIDASMSFN